MLHIPMLDTTGLTGALHPEQQHAGRRGLKHTLSQASRSMTTFCVCSTFTATLMMPLALAAPVASESAAVLAAAASASVPFPAQAALLKIVTKLQHVLTGIYSCRPKLC